MKAAIYTKYGSPDVVQIAVVEKPVPKDEEVLIKVHAASVNPLDWHFMRGLPYVVRLIAGLRRPKDQRLGVDVAGQVEAVGKNVTQFKPGDAVFGSCHGAFAQYACTSESALALKPNNTTYEQAAAVPIAAFTALQGFRLAGKVQPDQRVLINGAAGGVGTFAVQIAKSYGAEVTAVCSARNVQMLRSIGADHVIDYTQTDFTRSPQRYDIFFDLVANHSVSACARVLNPLGTYIPAGGEGGRWMAGALARALASLVLSRFVSQNLVAFFVATASQQDLTVMCERLQSGKVTPVIDRRYSLTEVSDAIRYLETKHARGKVVIIP
jgi:NADPH:quinone reductase-like Zn-dependent oxidoreductase